MQWSSFICLYLSAASFPVPLCHAGENKPATNAPAFYRMAQLDDAKKRATAEAKPIAWIASQPEFLTPHPKPMGKSSHAATTYAILALQKEAVIVFSDSNTENHHEPGIVDEALHTPEKHYTIPGVIILTPSLDKVICKAPFSQDSQERIQVFTEVLKKIRDKQSWAERQ
jgi:hypothetical protein